MYKSFRIRNFRCFDDITIEPLQRVNLITGKNNVGKTAFLEALWLHHGYYNPELGLRLRMFRGLSQFKRDEFLWDLFSGFDPKKRIELSSMDEDTQERSLRISVYEQPTSRLSLRKEKSAEMNGEASITSDAFEKETTSPIETEVRWQYTGDVEAHAYLEPDGVRIERPPGIKEPLGIFSVARGRDNLEVLAERFGNLAIEKRDSEIVEIMRIIEPRLQRLTVQHRGGGPIIYGDIGAERLIPLPMMGDGMGRLLGFALAIPEAQDGVFLIDEVENGLHYSVMESIWKALGQQAEKHNVQIFATTHSEECVHAAYDAYAQEKQFDFALHRLERVKGTIQVVSYDQDKLEAAFEIDVEVR